RARRRARRDPFRQRAQAAQTGRRVNVIAREYLCECRCRSPPPACTLPLSFVTEERETASAPGRASRRRAQGGEPGRGTCPLDPANGWSRRGVQIRTSAPELSRSQVVKLAPSRWSRTHSRRYL